MSPEDVWQYDLSSHGGQAQQSFQGLMVAATTNEVAVPALAAASTFGMLIPLSHSARTDVEKAATTSASAPVKFLQAEIGFSPGDIATYLSQSEGGVRFLGLASALLCTMDSKFRGAALHRMLQATRSPSLDDRAVPTNQQLAALVEALEPKLSRTGFTESVAGWQVYLVNLRDVDPAFTQLCRDDSAHPSVEMLHAIVSAFRHIDLIGETDNGGEPARGQSDTVTHVEIRTNQAIPWITAFTKWMLGLPPSIRLLDGTWVVRPEAAAKVELFVATTLGFEEEVRIVYRAKEPTTLWKGRTNGPDDYQWKGMLPVSEYGKLRFLGLCGSDQESLILQEALSYSLRKIASQLWPTTAVAFSGAPSLDPPYHPARSDPNLAEFRSSMFPDAQKILQAFQDYTGTSTRMASREGSVFLAPAVRAHEEQLARLCSCKSRSNITGEDADSTLPGDAGKGWDARYTPHRTCPVNAFRKSVALVSAEILSLSLFDCSEPVRLFWPGQIATSLKSFWHFPSAALRIIESIEESTPGFCRVQDIIHEALMLVGHDPSNLAVGCWIASAERGQTFYPALLDTGVLDKSGVLSLAGGPGRIISGRDAFDTVARQYREMDTPPLVSGTMPPLVEPLCLFQDQKLDWEVTPRGRTLLPSFGPTGYHKFFDPFRVLETVARSLFVCCDHPPSRPLERPCEDARFSRGLRFSRGGPAYFSAVEKTGEGSMERVDDKIEVIAVSENEPLRLFTMSSDCPGVVRFGACLECCLDVCAAASLPYIVL